MTQSMKDLLLGALKSGIAGATGMIIALPIVDPAKFSIVALGGWGHLGLVILIVTIIAEARFWNQWATAINAPKT